MTAARQSNRHKPVKKTIFSLIDRVVRMRHRQIREGEEAQYSRDAPQSLPR